MKFGPLLVAATAAAFLGGYTLGHSQNTPPLELTRPSTMADWQALASVLTLAGQQLGYSVKVAPGEFGTVAATYVKEGKSDTGHGVLGTRWDERETIQIRYVPTQDGLQPSFVRRTIEQKPPIGDWKVVGESSDVPAALLAVKPDLTR